MTPLQRHDEEERLWSCSAGSRFLTKSRKIDQNPSGLNKKINPMLHCSKSSTPLYSPEMKCRANNEF